MTFDERVGVQGVGLRVEVSATEHSLFPETQRNLLKHCLGEVPGITSSVWFRCTAVPERGGCGCCWIRQSQYVNTSKQAGSIHAVGSKLAGSIQGQYSKQVGSIRAGSTHAGPSAFGRRGNTLKGMKDFFLKAKARIWLICATFSRQRVQLRRLMVSS